MTKSFKYNKSSINTLVLEVATIDLHFFLKQHIPSLLKGCNLKN